MTESQVYDKHIPGFSRMPWNEDKYNLWGKQPVEVQNAVMLDLQYLSGKGQDYLSVQEYNSVLLDIHSHIDLASYWEAIAESYRNHEFIDYENCDSGFGGIEIAMLVEGKLHFCELWSAEEYIKENVSNAVSEWLFEECDCASVSLHNLLYPIFDETDPQPAQAYGKAFDKACSEINNEVSVLAEWLNRQSPAAYMQECNWGVGVSLALVVKNKNSARLVRPEYFVSDMAKIMQESSYLDMQIRRITKLVIDRFKGAPSEN
ncbi:hypothetical protein AB4254_12080 [Vibrio breoganii]